MSGLLKSRDKYQDVVDDILKPKSDLFENKYALLQCSHPGCIYVAAREDHPTTCIFHGKQEFTHDITSPWMLSIHKKLFRLIPNGYLSLYRSNDNLFVGVMLHAKGLHTLITSSGEIHSQVPKEYQSYFKEIFRLANPSQSVNNTTERRSTGEAVTCQLCGFVAPNILDHIEKEHFMTREDYRIKTSGAPILCKVLKDKYIARQNELWARKQDG